jgi:chemotaxis protein CheC
MQTRDATRLERLHQLLAAATRDASAAMCRWTNGEIALTLDEIRELPLEDAVSELNLGDELLTMVVLSLDGDAGGQLVLAFDDENGRRLAASLLNRPFNTCSVWAELERSALTETGNILGCAYLNALTRLTGHELLPSAPYFVRDYAASVLQQALLMQATDADRALVCRTIFRREGASLDWRVFFVPSLTLRRTLEDALVAAP